MLLCYRLLFRVLLRVVIYADSHSNPQRVHLLSGKGVVKMAAGLEHSLALTDSGDLYAFGDNLRY